WDLWRSSVRGRSETVSRLRNHARAQSQRRNRFQPLRQDHDEQSMGNSHRSKRAAQNALPTSARISTVQLAVDRAKWRIFLPVFIGPPDRTSDRSQNGDDTRTAVTRRI